MKKVRGYHLLIGASALMVLGFGIHLAVDYSRYLNSFTSAPFWLWIAVDAVLWLIPAALAFAAGLVSKKKMQKRRDSYDRF